jgi:DNA-binding transcriptional regulator YbjK
MDRDQEINIQHTTDLPRVVESRLTKIEIQTETISVELRHLTEEQRRLGSIIDQLSDVITALGKQQITAEATLHAVIDRTDLHAKEIENIQKEGVDVGKVLENLKSRVQLIMTIGSMVGGVVVTYVLSQMLGR